MIVILSATKKREGKRVCQIMRLIHAQFLQINDIEVTKLQALDFALFQYEVKLPHSKV